MLRLHNETTLSEEKVTLTAAMTGFKQPEVIKKALALIDTKDVRHQDVGYWIAYSFVNRYARDLTWQWLKTHWDWLDHNLGGDLSFYRMPVYVARAINDAKFLPQFTKFFEPRLSPAIQRSYDQGIEMIQWQSAWLTRDQKSIKAFFSQE